MSGSKDVLIVGAGVIGLTTAYTLARSGLSVTLLDSGDLGRQASWAGAGIIPPGNLQAACTPLEAIRGLSSPLFTQLSLDLLELSGIDNGYRICGGVELIGPEAEEDLDEYRGAGIDCQKIERKQLEELEGGLSQDWVRAYWIPGLAQIRNPRHLKALINACQKLGVQLKPHCPAQAFQCYNNRIVGVETGSGRLEAAVYVLCAGAWSQMLFQPPGWDLAIQPVRGQIALIKTDQPGLRPLLLAGKQYIVPREDGLVLVGSTEEHVGFDSRTTEAGISGLLEFAYALLPRLKNGHLQQSWAGIRPGSPDGLPTIGWVHGCDNLLVATGHFRVGLQLSPATALIIQRLILGLPDLVDLNPFRPARFASRVPLASIP